VDEPPKVPMHALAAPRIALVHSWINTQNEGWYRIAFDDLKIPYEYISDQKLRLIPDLRAKYDVILLGPTPGSSQRIVNGAAMRGAPIPWKKSDITPNLGMSPDTTDDMRGGMGMEGLIKEGAEVMGEDFEDEVMDAALIAAAQRVEHYEIAAYGTVCAFADLLGESGQASLLRETLEEEKETDQKLTELSKEINAQAGGGPESEEETPSKGTRSTSDNTSGKKKTPGRAA